MSNPTWSKRAQEIERAENRIASAIGLIRDVERIAELATEEELPELLEVLKVANKLKQKALTERTEAADSNKSLITKTKQGAKQ